MTSLTEFEGKNIEAALEKASSALNLPIEKIRYDVVSAGSSGIFGLVGVKNARIRITNGSKGGAGGRARQVAEEDRQEIQSMLDEAFADPQKEPKAKEKPKARKEKSPAPRERTRRATREAAPEQKAPPEQPSERETLPEAHMDAVPEAETAPEKGGVEVQETDVALAREILCNILENITDEATVTVSCGKDQVQFSVDGGNSSVLIGKRGKTLKAMQHIVEKVVRKAVGESVEVRVDVENYLEKREASLKTLASNLAEKARQTGKPTTISRMDSYERKIIHDTLRTDRSVKTRSVGNGDFRNVVIHPGGKKTQRKKTEQ